MKEEAIRALEMFKQQHLARPVEVPTKDIVSPSHYVPQPIEETMEPIVAKAEGKTKSINYPDHVAPLKQRMLSALNNGARSIESVARYAKEGEKLVGLQLNLMVSRGLIGKHIVPSSGNVKYYPADIAKQMGILKPAQPINRKGKKAKPTPKFVKPKSLEKADEARQLSLFNDAPKARHVQETAYIAFLEKRITEWQTEARRMAKQITELEDQVVQARADVVKAKTEPRNVTGEVQEVMVEVKELRATIAYLESKLFGRK